MMDTCEDCLHYREPRGPYSECKRGHSMQDNIPCGEFEPR